MNLSPLQRKTLELYQNLQHSPPTVSRLLALTARNYLRLLLVIGAGIVLMLSLRAPAFSLILVGMLIGVLSRDLGAFRKTVRVWPALVAVLDWNRIDQLLADDNDDTVA